jgi:branched-chain amino acid transport system ATP-binding protein
VGELPLDGGTVELFGAPCRQLYRNAVAGLAFVPEEKSVIMRLSLMDNLRLGAGDPEVALELFPELAGLKGRRAGLLSGGEQQMLTLGRALAAKPRLLIADEISLGLGPIIVTRLLTAIRSYVDTTGAGALIVEQQARRALSVADRWVLMRRGQIAAAGLAADGLGAAEAEFLAAADHAVDVDAGDEV